ncbi:methyl-accepting chemotaxis protein [Paenalcaligenes hominis]|uniref:methyl-accepting chemotaxis protein n=1 Tax=Paenalcaligenes hominis TaxID=643674 RepID=UPI003523A619
MRKNYPVHDTEIKVLPDQYLISKTDLKGRITYANPAFIEISGFTHDELIGKAHNIVRHPDMPAEAFADLWQTLQDGKPWLGLVKNRRKDGGFYWVQALVSPIIENEQITGYSSVRVRPTDQQVIDASNAYDKLNKNTLHGYTLQHGQLVRTGWRKHLARLGAPFQPTIAAATFRLVLLSLLSIAFCFYLAFFNNSLVTSEGAYWLMGIAAALGISISVLGWRLVRQATAPLINASHVAQQIAAGNLMVDTDRLESQHRGHSQKLFFILSIMRKGLSAIAGDTHQGIQASLHVAHHLHQNNELLASRTQDQAVFLEQTAASMEELTTTVQQNADNAQEASRLAERSMHTAQQGGQVVNELVTTMQDIHHRSKQIADIITVIDGIAFQTNILALNAAVESARAGEAGRGFAVVAGEVRSLAQRSAQAANEIKTLIDASVERVAAGARQAEHAGTTMHDVVTAVDQVNQIIHDIASASTEQATGLQQVHRAMEQMDGVTQQNNQLVGELGRTVEQLSAHAQSLDQAIRVLNTRATHTAPPQQTAERLLG